MKWINGETWESKYKRKQQWHKWFAWRPVVIEKITVNGEEREVKVWLQFIMRCGCYWDNYYDSGWDWRYRLIQESEHER